MISIDCIFFCTTFLLSSRFITCKNEWPNEIVVVNVGKVFRNNVALAVLKDAENGLKNSSIVPNDVIFRYYFEFACDELSSLTAVAKLKEKYNPDVYLGPECSTGAPSATLLTSYYNVATIGYLSITSELNNKTKYRTLSRVAFAMTPMGKAVKTLMTMNNWTQFAIVRSARSECTSALSGIYSELAENPFKLKGEFFADTLLEFVKALDQVKFVARIIILCFDWTPSSAFDFLIQAKSSEMLNPEYVYIILSVELRLLASWKPWDLLNQTDTGKISLAKTVFSNSIVVQTIGFEIDLLSNYKNYLEDDVYNRTGFPFELSTGEAIIAPRLHDAMFLYGRAVNKTIQSGGDYRNGSAILDAVKLEKFDGASGKVVIDVNGERIPEYIIYSRSMDMDDLTPTHTFSVSFLNNNDFTYVAQNVRKPFWNTVNNETPLDQPICGFSGELCRTSRSITITIVAGLLAVVALIFSAGFLLYRRKKREQELIRMSWKFYLKDLQQFTTKQSVASLMSESNKMSARSSVRQTNGVGTINNEIVTIKTYKKLTAIHLNREQLLNLKTLRDITHENLNLFIGANLDDDPDVILFLWKNCAKGSLTEIIYNDDIQLDMMFKSSMIKDVIMGLEYLHKSPIGYHGNLKCNSCLVDSRWIVKLTDFGLTSFINSLKSKVAVITAETDISYNDFIHLAPEVVKLGIDHVDKKAADIFSLAMVFYQILFRQEPYPHTVGIKQGYSVENFCCPKFPETYSDVDPTMLSTLKMCWSEIQSERPTISDIKRLASGFTKKFGKNLVDHILSMLEKYANNLETIVEERTQQVIEERRRADHLLYQLLPRSVADSLKKGESILPEFYDSVTIYFSDIVQFTNLCSRSTPLEVVTMLNKLYSESDSLLNSFDVYKVETIGDAYMVVSGLPNRNGAKHVTEIANMALEMMKYISRYRVPHFPDLGLQLRIGIHSGPAAAGVIGLKMPHFCLFGDTVNLASRMESSSEPGKIQISESTQELLNVCGIYKINFRGLIEIKGKGLCNTYWLEQKN